MANYVYIAVSLDGYIADRDGGVQWLEEIPNPEGNDFGFGKFMEGVDGILMGRKTFEKVLSFGVWPYTKRVFVLSTTLKKIPEALKEKAEIIEGEPETILTDLKERGYEDLYIDGGRTIQGFLKEGLIQEMIITTIPVILGGGIPLFGSLDEKVSLELVGSEVLVDALVKTHYRVVTS